MMTTSMRTLLHGEALVDFRAHADGFVPHVGGSAARIAVAAAQAGADVALAAVVGDDEWGRWVVEHLRAAGVGTDLVTRDPEQLTPLSFTPGTVHGAPIVQRPGERADVDALVLGADTLATDEEQEATLAVRDAALQADRPVLVDATFAAHRWETPAFAASATRELVKGAFVVVAGAEEARLLSGEEHPAAAADGLVAMGATHAIVVAPAGVVLRGPGLKLASAGAVDHAALVGSVIAELAATDFYPPAIAAALK